MNFKNFFITENLAYLAKDLGVLLASLQEYQEELESLQKLPKKRLNNICNSAFNKIKGILHSGNIPRNNQREILILQKVCYVLHEIEKNELDYKEYLPKVVKNLEYVITNLGMPVNKIGSTDSAPAKETDSTEKTEKSNFLKSAEDKAPPQAKDVSSITNPTAPNAQADQLYSQPLGGSSGPLSAF